MLAEFSSARLALAVPDLSGEGLQFKRAQRLTFGQQPLLQMAYLPAQGKPTALCVLKRPPTGPLDDPQHASPVTVLQLHGLTVVTWMQGALAYALAIGARKSAGIAPGVWQGAGVAGLTWLVLSATEQSWLHLGNQKSKN